MYVRSDGRAIQAEFVDPDGDTPPNSAISKSGTAEKSLALAEMILAATGSEAEVKALAHEHAGVEQTLASRQWDDLKAGLTDKMAAADFWSQPDRHATLARLALMDRVKTAATTADC